MTAEQPTILVIDDQADVRGVLRTLLADEGMRTIEAAHGAAGLERLRTERPDAVLLDLRMPGPDGFEVLEAARKCDASTPIIVVTGHGSIGLAVRAVKRGAYDFLSKPFTNDEVVLTVRRALREHALAAEVERLRGRDDSDHPLYRTMGRSVHVTRRVHHIDRVADSNLTVLVTGESGVGKELVAEALVGRSTQWGARMVALDCGSIPAGLVENELFGHEEGAYTGASKSRPGKFEAADGGTLFLDEISNLTSTAQGTLLRVLQDRKVARVGSVRPIPVNIRLIAATNRNLGDMVRAGEFRADLYHRLAEFEVRVPALRERKEDIPFLVERFIHTANEENGREVKGLSSEALPLLIAYDWPGNVRQLRNVIRRAVVLAEDAIEPRHLTALGSLRTGGAAPCFGEGVSLGADGEITPLKETVRRSTQAVEKAAIERALTRTGGNKAQAARLLKVDYKTIYNKLKAYDMEAAGR